MTNKSKRLTKIIFFCLGISLLLFNCEKTDDDIDITIEENHTSNIDLEFIDYSVAKQNSKLIEKLNTSLSLLPSSKSTLKADKSKSSEPNHSSDLKDYTILTDKVIYVSENDYHSYTFSLVREQPTHLIENLVLSQNKDGDYDAFIASYNLTDTQKQELLNNTLLNLPKHTSFTKIEDFNPNSLFSKVYQDGNYCYKLVQETSRGTGWNIIRQVQVDCQDSGNGSGGDTSGIGSNTGSDDGFGGSTGNGSGGLGDENNDDEQPSGGGGTGNSNSEPGNRDVLTSPFISPSLIVIKDLGITNELQIKFLNENQDLAKQIDAFILLNGHTPEIIEFNKQVIEFAFSIPDASDDNRRTFIEGQLELEKLHRRNTITLKPISGKINGRDDQKYTHFGTNGVYSFYKMEDGSIVLSSPSELTLNSDGKLVAEFTSETSNSHYWYIKPEGSATWSNYLIKTNYTNLAHELEITAKLALLELGKAIGTYVLPVEDIKILITGTDFDGEQVSRYQAAGFLLLTVIPGSKALKVVGKASDAISVVVKLGSNNLVVDSIETGLKIVTDNNIVKFLSKTGDEIARVVDGVMTFNYKGFGGKIITNPNKTTTVIGKWKNGTQEIIESGLSKSGKNKGGINALSETPDPNWNDQQIWDNLNEPWLDEAIDGADIIRVISDPLNKNNIFKSNLDNIPNSVFNSSQSLSNFLLNLSPQQLNDLSFFGREIRHLFQNGYIFDSATKQFVL